MTTRRAALVGVMILPMALLFGAPASAQTAEPDPPSTDCSPLSLLCGMQFQVGPFGPFDLDFLPGGSVFPPPST